MYQPYQDNERMAMQEQDLLARERLKESGYDPRRAGRTSWKRNLLMAPGEILIVLGLVGGALGGWLGSLIGIGGGWVTSILLAIGGSCLIIWILRLIKKK